MKSPQVFTEHLDMTALVEAAGFDPEMLIQRCRQTALEMMADIENLSDFSRR